MTMKVSDILNDPTVKTDGYGAIQQPNHTVSQAHLKVKPERGCMPWVRSIFGSNGSQSSSSVESSHEMEKRALRGQSHAAPRRLGMVLGHIHPYSRASPTEDSTDDGIKKKRARKGRNQKDKKRITEKLSRELVNQSMGLLERSLIEKKPTLPLDRNWNRLNSSNIGSKNREQTSLNTTPLEHNKLDVLTTTRVWQDQTEPLLTIAMDLLRGMGKSKLAENFAECLRARCTENFEGALQTLFKLDMEE